MLSIITAVYGRLFFGRAEEDKAPASIGEVDQGERTKKFKYNIISLIITLVTATGLLLMILYLRKNTGLSPGSIFSFLLGVISVYLSNWIFERLNPRRLTNPSPTDDSISLWTTAFRKAGMGGTITTAMGLIILTALILTFKSSGVRSLILFAMGLSFGGILTWVGGLLPAPSLKENSPDEACDDSVFPPGFSYKNISLGIWECYMLTIIASALLGAGNLLSPWFRESYQEFAPHFAAKLTMYPFLIAGIGIPASLAGLIVLKKSLKSKPEAALIRCLLASTGIIALGAFLVNLFYLVDPTGNSPDFRFFGALAVGLFVGWMIPSLLHGQNIFSPGQYQESSTPGKENPSQRLASVISSLINSILVPSSAIFLVLLLFRGHPVLGIYGIGIVGLGAASISACYIAMSSMGASARFPTGSGPAGDTPITGEVSAPVQLPEHLSRHIYIILSMLAALAFFLVFSAGTHLIPASMSIRDGKLLFGPETVNFTPYNFQDILASLGIQLNLPPVFLGLILGMAAPLLAILLQIRVRMEFLRACVSGEKYRTRILQKAESEGTRIKEIDAAPNCVLMARCLLHPLIPAIALPVILGFGLGISSLGAFFAGAIITGFVISLFIQALGKMSAFGETGKEIIPPGKTAFFSSEKVSSAITGIGSLNRLMILTGSIILPLIIIITGNPVFSGSFPFEESLGERLPYVIFALAALIISISFPVTQPTVRERKISGEQVKTKEQPDNPDQPKREE